MWLPCPWRREGKLNGTTWQKSIGNCGQFALLIMFSAVSDLLLRWPLNWGSVSMRCESMEEGEGIAAQVLPAGEVPFILTTSRGKEGKRQWQFERNGFYQNLAFFLLISYLRIYKARGGESGWNFWADGSVHGTLCYYQVLAWLWVESSNHLTERKTNLHRANPDPFETL